MNLRINNSLSSSRTLYKFNSQSIQRWGGVKFSSQITRSRPLEVAEQTFLNQVIPTLEGQYDLSLNHANSIRALLIGRLLSESQANPQFQEVNLYRINLINWILFGDRGEKELDTFLQQHHVTEVEGLNEIDSSSMRTWDSISKIPTGTVISILINPEFLPNEERVRQAANYLWN